MVAAGEEFEAMYQGEAPPWDIGRAQPVFVRLEEEGKVKGSVLDVGCGTGENALFVASRGHEVWGVDAAPTAIAKATQKAKRRKLSATFQVADALNLQLGRTFDTIIDSGLFHVFADEDRPRYATSLRGALQASGHYLMLCFSEKEPGDWGPRRVTQAEIRQTFDKGWKIESIEPAFFATHFHEEGARAWLSSIRRAQA